MEKVGYLHTYIRVWHELAGDSVTAHWLVRTLDYDFLSQHNSLKLVVAASESIDFAPSKI